MAHRKGHQNRFGQAVPSLPVKDCAAALRYYCDVLGFEKEQYGPIEPDPIADAMCELEGVSARGWILKHGYGLLEMWEFDSPRAEMPAETRKVNEFEGQHRFGGGTDYDCDPHVMDILGDHGQLAYECEDDGTSVKMAVLKMSRL